MWKSGKTLVERGRTRQSGIEMGEDRLHRLDLFEAVVFALYGNWLISLLSDRISFSKFPVNFNIFGAWYQAVCIGIAFSCLLILFVFSIFRPNDISKVNLFILYMGHLSGVSCALIAEDLTISNFIFFLIGSILFMITFLIEHERMRISRRKASPNVRST